MPVISWPSRTLPGMGGGSVTIEAVMDEARVVIIDREALYAQIARSPELAIRVMQVMADQHRELEQMLVYAR